jgi:CubicO group peptidase (beta-lactamase class C family)
VRRLLACFLASLALFATATARADLPVTGTALPGLSSFDSAVITLLTKWKIPGASLAVAKDGRLVLARGYGYSDVGQMKPVTPDQRFRVASLSKSLTASAIMRLVEAGSLSLDEPALPLLGPWAPPAHEIVDPRVYQITVRHLLVHRGGWDREAYGDPVFDSREHLRDRDCRGVMHAELTRKLDFDPGSTFVYSNTGYCILGRIIERVSGMSYADFVTTQILQPAGAARMRLTHRAEFAIDEPVYYQTPGSAISPYEGVALDAIDSLAGWVTRPSDYLRYFLALNGINGKAILKPQSVAQMVRPRRPRPGPQRRPRRMAPRLDARDPG